MKENSAITARRRVPVDSAWICSSYQGTNPKPWSIKNQSEINAAQFNGLLFYVIIHGFKLLKWNIKYRGKRSGHGYREYASGQQDGMTGAFARCSIKG
jgi:hypothetical protein